MFRAFALAATIAAAFFGTSSVQAQSTQLVQFDAITSPIVPQAVLRGDREFGGNGPDLSVRVELSVERGGRAVFAHVTFTAAETGGDFSTTEITRAIQIWRWHPGLPLVRSIEAPVWFDTVRSRETCGMCAGAPDGAYPTVMTGGPYGVVEAVHMIGDTMGDDISTDLNPHGDTHIRSITFNPVLVEFSAPVGS